MGHNLPEVEYRKQELHACDNNERSKGAHGRHRERADDERARKPAAHLDDVVEYESAEHKDET